MSLEAFLAEVEKPESGGKGGAFITVAKVRVFFCWQGWTNGVSELFEFKAGNGGAETEAEIKCQEYIDSGSNNYEQWPQKGICTHVFGDWVPTNSEGKVHWGDTLDFVKKWESDTNFHKLSEDEQGLVAGPMPFNLVVDGIKAHPAAFEQEQCVKMSQEFNQWTKAKGKKNKKGYDIRVYVIQHVYENKAEAEADAQLIKAGQGQTTTQPQVDNDQLSALAIETWGQEGALSIQETLDGMKTQKASIENFIQNLQNGIGAKGGKKLGIPESQIAAANGHGMEATDLPLIGISEVPF